MFRRRVFRPVYLIFAALILACGVANVLRLEIPAWMQYLPFALSLVLFGLPHGALDHLVPARLSGQKPTPRSVGLVVVLYGALGAAVFLLWSVAPAAAFLFFIALTWFHWGQGDLWVVARLEESFPLSPSLRVGTLIIRGGLPMLVPLLAFPTIYHEVMAGSIKLFSAGGQSTPALDFLFDPTVRLALGVGFGVVIIVTLVLQLLAASWSPRPARAHLIAAWRRNGLEVVLLLAFFAVVPPVLAVGLYFCLWHAVRHIIRLELLDTRARASLARGILLPALRRFSVDALPVTIVALALLVALFFIVPRSGADANSLLGLYLVLISALTLPHVAIVTWMDHRQRLWSR